MTPYNTSEIPEEYVKFVEELSTLTKGPIVSSLILGFAQDWDGDGGITWIDLGCFFIAQDAGTGETELMHSFSNEEGVEVDSIVDLLPHGNHYFEHGIDSFTWPLLNSLVQSLDGSLWQEHEGGICAGTDADNAYKLRQYLLTKLNDFASFDCECGWWSNTTIQQLESLI